MSAHIFVGGPADGKTIDVPDGVPVHKVAYKIREVRDLVWRAALYEKRRLWRGKGGRDGQWVYYAHEGMGDKAALKRFLETLK